MIWLFTLEVQLTEKVALEDSVAIPVNDIWRFCAVAVATVGVRRYPAPNVVVPSHSLQVNCSEAVTLVVWSATEAFNK